MKRLAILLIFALLAGCTPPPTEEPDRGPIDIRGIGTGAGCNLGVVGGPWDSEHQFPRIITTDGDYVVSDSNESNLDAVARYDGVLWTLDWPTYANYSVTPEVTTPFAYVRALNDTTKFIGVNHVYSVQPSYCHIAETFPHRCDIVTVQDTADGYTASGDGWYAKDSGGGIISKGGDPVMNWSSLDPDHPTEDWANWFGDYIVSDVWTDQCDGERCWDAFYIEYMGIPHAGSGFAQIDADENGVRDLDESSRCQIDQNQMDGYRTFFDILATGGITVAGGEDIIVPGLSGDASDSYLLGYATAGFNGDFPRVSYADCSDNSYSYPPNDSRWDFNMRQAIQWEDGGNLVINLMGEDLYGAGGDEYYNDYVTTENQQRRLVVGSTLLINGYSVPHQDQLPNSYPCDECLVNASGQSTTAIADGGWLGCPLYDAVNSAGKTLRTVIAESGDLSATYWTREFANGLVIVNPTEASVNVPLGAGWKKISANGGYGGDTTHNSGAAVSSPLAVGAYDAYVLFRDTAATATPGPTATPGATSTPRPTSTVTPTGGASSATNTPTTEALACPGLPSSGTAILRNRNGVVVETVVYNSGGSNSYCAVNWETPPPRRTWTATGTPNPGNQYVTPTPTPTVTPTPT